MEQENKQLSVDAAEMFAAIDVGTTKCVALVGYKNAGNEIVICGQSNIESEGIWSGEVAHVSKAANSIKLAVEAASEEAGFFPKKVVVGVAGRHVRSQFFSVPKTRENVSAEITQEELDALKKDARNLAIGYDEEIINVVPQNYVLDGKEFLDPIGVSCKHIDANFQVIVGKIQALMQLKQCVQLAGLELYEDGLYLEPLASSDAVLTNEEKELGAALIDIGGGTTDIAIFKDSSLKATAVIPFGGNLITSDIKEAFGLSFKDAENIKKEYGEAIKAFAPNAVISFEDSQNSKQIPVDHLAGIIQSRLEEILDSASFEIGMTGLQRSLGAGIVVTGGGSNLRNMSQLINYKMGLNSVVSFPKQKVSYKEHTMFNNAIYSTAVGLLLKAAVLHEHEYKPEEKLIDVKKEKPVVENPENKNGEIHEDTTVGTPENISAENGKNGQTSGNKFWTKFKNTALHGAKSFFNVDDVEYK